MSEQPKKTTDEAPEVTTTEESKEESTLFAAPTAPTKQKPGKKRLRGLLIVLCVLVLLGGGVTAAYFGGLFQKSTDTDTSETETHEEEHLPSLVDYSATGISAIQKLTIQNEKGTYTLAPDDTGAMTVAGYTDLPRDGEAVEELLVQYTAVTPDLVIAENATAEQLTACGLDKPSITVTTQYEDGKTLTMQYGRLASGGESGYYGMEKGGKTVWLFEVEYYQTAMEDFTHFLGKTLISAPSPNSDDTVGTAKLKQLTLSGGNRDTAATLRYIAPTDSDSLRLCGKYVLEKPFLRAADNDVVSEWDTSLCGLYAATIEAVRPTEAKLASFGFSNPRAVAKMTFGVYVATDKDGKDLKTPKWYNEVTHTLTLGNRAEDGTYYAMLDGVDAVYTVNEATVPWAEVGYEDLVNKSLFLRYITDISAIKAQVGDTAYDLKLTHGKKKAEDGTETATLGAKLKGIEKDEASTRGLYQLMMSVKRVSAAPADAKADGKAVLKLQLVPLSGEAETTFTFYPYSANRYLCVDSDGDRFLVKTADVEAVAAQWNAYAEIGTTTTAKAATTTKAS